MKILHVLDHSLPEVDGYSIRSHNILLNQKNQGLDVVALTSPKQGKLAEPFEEFGGIRFYRTNYEEACNGFRSRPFIKEALLIRQLYRRILEIAQQEQIDLIHAHSPSLNGIPSYRVARRLRIPVVYEMRSLWEEGPDDQKRTLFETVRFLASRWIETQVLRRVNAVAVISQGLKTELTNRGLHASKIEVFPNGVDLERFTPRPINECLKQKLGLQGRFVVGFVGSFRYWEGLELLVQAAVNVVKLQPDTRVLLVGSDNELRLKNLVQSLGLEKFVTFTGGIVPDEILDYYSVIDILVYPRKKLRFTELVTPLKPLEAMGMGKTVLASNIGGHRELIQDGQTGFLFEPDSVPALECALIRLLKDSEFTRRLGKQAAGWVREFRSWRKTTAGYAGIYRNIVSHAEKSNANKFGQTRDYF